MRKWEIRKKAEEMLKQMTKLQPKNNQETRIIAEDAQNILLAYRSTVDDSNSNLATKSFEVRRGVL